MYEYGKGLIKCLDCKKNYRGKTERGKKVYVCGGYHNRQTDCLRYQLDEDELNHLVAKHLEIVGRMREDGKSERDYVKKIEVSGKSDSYTIHYKDGTKSIINNNDQYGIMVKY